MPDTTQVITQVRKNGNTRLAYRAGSLGKPKNVVGLLDISCDGMPKLRRGAAGKMVGLRTALL